MPVNGFVDLSRVHALKEAVLIGDGYKVITTDESGHQIEVADMDGFKKKVDDIIVSLPDATMTNKAKNGRTFHSVLVEVLPSLKVDNLDIDEKRVYGELVTQVKKRCGTGPTGPIQLRLQGRILCTGTILTKDGPLDGVWISSTPSPTGPLAEAWEKRVVKWAKEVKSLTDYGRMTTNRVPQFSKHAIVALEAHAAEVNAAIEAFKQSALTAGQALPEQDED